MRKKALLLVDISNIYYCLRKQFGGAKLRYEKLLEFLESKNYEITRKIAYGSEDEIHHKFQTFLHRQLGFEVERKRPTMKGADWDVGIAVDSVMIGLNVVNKQNVYDAVIFATGDGDMAPALHALKHVGKTVVVIGAKVSVDLKRIAHESYEITEDLFEATNDSNRTSGEESVGLSSEGPEHSTDSGRAVSGELAHPE